VEYQARTLLTRTHRNLVRDLSGRDDFGRPGRTWRLRGELIGTYDSVATITWTTGMTEAQVNTAIGAGRSIHATVTSLVNGFDVGAGTFFNRAILAGATGNGTLVQLFSLGNNNIIDVISIIRTDITSVSAINATARTVTLTRLADQAVLAQYPTEGTAASYTIPHTSPFYSTVSDLAVGSFVLVTPRWVDGTTPAYVADNVALPRTVVGPVASVVATGQRSITIGGSAYSFAARRTTAPEGVVATASDRTLVLDAYGFVVHAPGVTPVTRNWLMVSRFYSVLNDAGEIVNMVSGVLANGDEVNVRYSGAAITLAPANRLFYVTSVTAAGVYNLFGPITVTGELVLVPPPAPPAPHHYHHHINNSNATNYHLKVQTSVP
jgi:hypothetical protein